jgi:hypothetical protein
MDGGTPTSRPALRPGSRVASRMARRIPDLARRAVERFTVEVPMYGLLPREELDGEILDVTIENLRLFMRLLKDGRGPSREELGGIVASAARRAEERVPLTDVLAAYHIGARLAWLELIDVAEPDDTDDLLGVSLHVLHYLQELTSSISTVYVEVQQTIHGDERVARRELATALVTGAEIGALAERAGAVVAPAYVVLVLALEPPAGGPGSPAAVPDPGAAVSERRRIRQLQAELDAFAGQPVLGLLGGQGGTALLPATPETVAAVDRAVGDLMDRLAGAAVTDTDGPDAAAAGRAYGATATATTVAAVPGAVDLARVLVDLAGRLGRGPGLYRLPDLLVEYQLTRPGPARDELAGKLDSIADQAHLLETLRAYMAHERRRRPAAAALHVHPNTLDYRLGRIAALTGLDPARQSDSQVLLAALTVRDQRDGRV